MFFPIGRFKVEDKSMEPEFKPGDYVLVNRLAYIASNPSKGDVVVLTHPNEKHKVLIKRMSLVSNSGEFYVVGDNKGFSQDSRHFGPIRKDFIIGKVILHAKQ